MRTKWFTEARFGMFIHFGLYSIAGKGEWHRTHAQVADDVYRAYAPRFSVDRWNPASWASLARRTGMKYSVMTVKHHDGFCLFDTAHTEFKSTNSPVGRDLARDYLDAFRAEGLRAGLYYSLIDWNHPEYPIDRLHPHRNHADYNLPLGPNPEPHRDMLKYRQYLFAQVQELLENYGEIPLMWFDYSFDEKGPEDWDSGNLLKLIREKQPDILLNSRLERGHLSGHRSKYSGDFFTPEQFIPGQGYHDENGNSLPWEACITLSDNWGYNPDDCNYKTSRQIIQMLADCVSKDGNLLLNISPDAAGGLRDEAVALLEKIGKWMERNGKSIYGCGPAKLPKPDWGCWTQRGNKLYAHVFAPPVTTLVLPGLGNRIAYATRLSDGSDMNMTTPWMFAESQAPDAYIAMPPVSTQDEADTVIELTLKD